MMEGRDLLPLARVIVRYTGLRGLAMLACLIVSTLSEGVSILLLVPVLQLIGPGDRAVDIVSVVPSLRPLGFGSLPLSLEAVLACLFAAVALQTVFARFTNLYVGNLLYDVSNRIRMDLFDAISAAHWSFVSRLRGSDVQHALTGDIDRIEGCVFHLFLLVQSSILILLYTAISASLSLTMSAAAFAAGVVALVALYPVRRRALRFGEKLTQSRQSQYQIASEFLIGLKVAKSFNTEGAYRRELNQLLSSMRADFIAYLRVSSLGTAAFQIASLAALATFVVVALRVFALPLPTILVLTLVFYRIAPRFSSLQRDMQQVLQNLSAFKAVDELRGACLRHAEAEQAEASPMPEAALTGAITLREVGFRYPEAGSDTLSDVDLVIPAHSVLALIGPSGGGKSTLADLLTALLQPTTGSIHIGATELTPALMRPWRDRVAYVPQEVFLLHDTIAANLRLASPGASDAELWAAIDAAQVGDVVRGLPQELETVIGDRGLRLSGGERQRVALARALLRRPQLLVLDEATSALDLDSQTEIAATIARLKGSMTIVTITHRLSMTGFADHVAVLDGGRVVERGDAATMRNSPTGYLARLARREADLEKGRGTS